MDARAKKISETMRARRLDNFKQWRDRMKELGKIKSTYPAPKKDGKLAELIGTVLGDGHIYKHPPTSTYKLFFANKNQYLLKLVATLVTNLGFTQNTYINKVQVSRKTDVQELKDLLQFRSY